QLPKIERMEIYARARDWLPFKRHDRRMTIHIKVLAIYHQGAVPEIVLRQQGPSLALLCFVPQLKPLLFQLVVILITRVNHPADTIQLKNEAPCVHVPVVERSHASFGGQIEAVAVGSRITKHHYGIIAVPYPAVSQSIIRPGLNRRQPD